MKSLKSPEDAIKIAKKLNYPTSAPEAAATWDVTETTAQKELIGLEDEGYLISCNPPSNKKKRKLYSPSKYLLKEWFK